jgi:heme/copper-type cytochrome/quinol oxidase subunit 2
MPDPATRERYTRRDFRRPSFITVVIMSAIALIVFFVVAWLVVRGSGAHMLAPTHPDTHPHSVLRLPDTGGRAA